MSAIQPTLRVIRSNGTVAPARQPSRERNQPAVSAEQMRTPEDASDVVSRIIQDMRVLGTERKPRIDFEDVVCTSGTNVRLEHRFSCRVRWSVVDWEGADRPKFSKDSSTTTLALVLTCGQSGTATFRVEAV